MNKGKMANMFPLGTHLCREPMPPMAELKRDMDTLKKHGFNLIKLQENWMVDEPNEGDIRLEKYEELIRHAAVLDMGIYLGLTCEQAPGWLWKKHPECRMIGRDGVPIAYEAQTTLPGDGKPGPCYDHPGAMADMLRFITRLVEFLYRYENIVVWNTWQEIGYWSEAFVGQHVCYCPHTLRHYRQWLAGKFKQDLDALNRAWGTRYGNWEAILPERSKLIYPCPQESYWRMFMDNVQITRILQERARTIRDADHLHRPIFAHKGGPIIGSSQDWAYARAQDFLGSSSYPAWGCAQEWDDLYQKQPYPEQDAVVGETWGRLILPFDYIRSANIKDAPIWAAELQGGSVNTGFHKGRTITAKDIRWWMLNAVACDVTAISFWVTRSEIMAAEMNGFSLLNSTGDTSQRLAEAARVGEALNRHADLFGKQTLLPARLAILVDESNYQITSITSNAIGHLAYSMRGWHRLLWENSIPVDFIPIEEVPERGSSYTALILPFPLSLSEKAANALVDYVSAGGQVICESCPGRLNENSLCNRGEVSPALAEFFGITDVGLKMVREPAVNSRWSPRERTWGEFHDQTMLGGVGLLTGHSLRANLYIETYLSNLAKPVFKNEDDVTGLKRDKGLGSFWLIGTVAGHNSTAYRDPATWRCLLKILEVCGIVPDVKYPLMLRRRVAGTREAWIYTNSSEERKNMTIPIEGWSQIEDLFQTPLERDKTATNILFSVEPFDMRIMILTR